MFPQRLDRLLPRNPGLIHDEFDILGLESRIIHLLPIIILLILLLLGRSSGGSGRTTIGSFPFATSTG